jgi:hypothetical protein
LTSYDEYCEDKAQKITSNNPKGNKNDTNLLTSTSNLNDIKSKKKK